MQYSAEGEALPPPPHVRYRSPSGDEPGVFDITPSPALAAAAASAGPLSHNGTGTAALVLGCLALVCTGLLFFLFPLGLVLGLIAVALGRKGRRRARYGLATNRSCATAGLTLGLVALLLGTLLSATTVWVVQRYDTGAIRDCVKDQPSAIDAGRCILDVVDNS